MIAIIALILAVIAVIGLMFHAVLADSAHGGVAHMSTTINDRLMERFPGTFSSSAIVPTTPPPP